MGKKWKVSDFILRGSKITADGDCSHEIERRLLFGRKVMTNLDNILRRRDITLTTKVCLVKAMVFPVVKNLPFNTKDTGLIPGYGSINKIPHAAEEK